LRYGWAKALVIIGVVAALASCNRDAAPAANGADDAALREAAAFMQTNAKAEGVQTLPSGVQYKVIRSGPATGAHPDSNDLVSVHYEGTLTDGTVFDSSYQRGVPAVFNVDRMVPGWTEILQHMRVGDEWIVYLPPEAGYGAEARGPIPANAVLVFRMELLDLSKVPGESPPTRTAMG
jgi:FKBP-type peptidyl-prolyl cis-trans isomerase FklB